MFLTLRSILISLPEAYDYFLRVRGPFILLLEVILPETRNSRDEFSFSCINATVCFTKSRRKVEWVLGHSKWVKRERKQMGMGKGGRKA